ncbi:MAG: adenylate/guanylate cyclase domain-containing protein [Desulfobacteraceae bacterium]|nr:adenylate/guanylate cyclase domain-containing protein [Desulfobacteraceae bacterium]
MEADDVQRKLAAILSADVQGYSRLMQNDESATVATLTTYRDLMFTLIEQHHGRVVDSPGDNLLAEFSSVVDAVQGAVSIQKELKTRNEKLSFDRRMEFRIGINLGDVIVQENRIYGDGVNIAARLEALSDAGGICISRTAFDQIEDKLPLGYEYIGEQEAKNMQKPLRAYKVNIWQENEKPKIKVFKQSDSGAGHGQTKRSIFSRKSEKERETIRIKKGRRTRKRYKNHLRSYLGIIVFLFIINMITSHDTIWFHWPALGWGMAIFLHWVKASSSYHPDE